MNLELIGWLVAGFIISEIIFIIMLKFSGNFEEWIQFKFLSFLMGAGFTFIQAIVVFGSDNTPISSESHYIRLVWEALIIAGILIFFGLNKLVVNHLKKQGDEQDE